jgi:hypothetical protein
MPAYLHVGANAPGLAAPEQQRDQPLKSETQHGANGLGFKGQGKADAVDCAHTGQPDQARVAHGVSHPSRTGEQIRSVPAAKRLATAKAYTALWGGTLTAVEGDDGRLQFIVTRWSLTRAFDDLAAVEGFLVRVGAAR